MKKFFAGALLLAAALSFSTLAPTVAAAQNIPPGSYLLGSIVDVDAQQLPSEVALPPGTVVIFVRKIPFVGSNVTASPSHQTAGSPMQLVPTKVIWRSEYQVIGAFKVSGVGSVDVEITHTIVAPNAQPHTETVKVTVPQSVPGSRACYKTTVVLPDAKGNLFFAPTVTCN